MSHWHLTLDELAFLVPGGVIVGAVMSYLAARKGTRESIEAQEQVVERTIRAQRQQTLDEKLWLKRSELYPLLATAIVETRRLLIEAKPSARAPVGAAAREAARAHAQQLASLIPVVNTFAGDEVRSLWTTYTQRVQHAVWRIEALGDSGPPTETPIRARYTEILSLLDINVEEIETTACELSASMRNDLQAVRSPAGGE